MLLCTLLLAGCQGRARGVETIVSMTGLHALLGSGALPGAKGCLWISGLSTPSTVISVLIAHDTATIEECGRITPQPPVQFPQYAPVPPQSPP